MTKRLILIRHAKSGWDDAYADDHARVLNKRGQASATAIGQWMGDKGYLPDVILCSDAMRTEQTAKLILAHLTPRTPLKRSAMLYHAAPDTILDLLQKETADTVAIIAHNPSIGMLANALVRIAPEHHRFSNYPTCATTIIDFDINTWMMMERGSGTCVDFAVPRDLIGTAGNDMN